MRTSATTAIVTTALGLVIAAPVFAEGPTDFTATAVQSLPSQPAQIGLIAKSGSLMRFEYAQDGHTLIKILRPTEGLSYILDPETRTYTEIHATPTSIEELEGRTSPCPAPSQNLRCERSGSDVVVSGVQAERWLLGLPDQNPQVILWDPARSQALRHEFPDGSVMQMSFIAMEDMKGRAVEHWSTSLTGPDHETLTGDWWYSTELRMVLGEDLPGGEIRRLENITIGPVDPSLFQVPEGWQKLDAPGPPVLSD